LTSTALIGGAGSEVGLLCGFHLRSVTEVAQELQPGDVETAVASGEGVIWLHLNLSNARARQLVGQSGFIPREARDAFCAHDGRRRVELVEDGLLSVISDLTFEEGSEPEDQASLWSYSTDRLLITGRTQPLQTSDRLRAAVRAGLRVATGHELLLWILNQRTASLRDLTAEMSEQVGDIEDEILSGRIREQREQLGRIRRFCAQLRRHFGPDRTAFRRLLQHPQLKFGADVVEGFRFEIEELSFLIEEVLELYERRRSSRHGSPRTRAAASMSSRSCPRCSCR